MAPSTKDQKIFVKKIRIDDDITIKQIIVVKTKKTLTKNQKLIKKLNKPIRYSH